MIPIILAKLESDPSYALPDAASDIADIFSSLAKLSENSEYLRTIYQYLRTQPALSRLVFDNLIKRHNEACAAPLAGSFMPGCCCCGIDPYEPSRQLSRDIELLQADLLSRSGSVTAFIKLLGDYRAKAHEHNGSVAIMKADKQSVGLQMFSRFTSPVVIESEEADFLYGVLERNECIGEDLLEYANAGARLALLAQENAIIQSPVVESLGKIFGNGGGGGCCCCCCCCCCGGGC